MNVLLFILRCPSGANMQTSNAPSVLTKYTVIVKMWWAGPQWSCIASKIPVDTATHCKWFSLSSYVIEWQWFVFTDITVSTILNMIYNWLRNIIEDVLRPRWWTKVDDYHRVCQHSMETNGKISRWIHFTEMHVHCWSTLCPSKSRLPGFRASKSLSDTWSSGARYKKKNKNMLKMLLC